MEAYGNETCTGVCINDDCDYILKTIINAWMIGITTRVAEETNLQVQVYHDDKCKKCVYYHPKFDVTQEDYDSLSDLLLEYVGDSDIEAGLYKLIWSKEEGRYIHAFQYLMWSITYPAPEIKIPELKVPELRVPEIRIPEEPLYPHSLPISGTKWGHQFHPKAVKFFKEDL